MSNAYARLALITDPLGLSSDTSKDAILKSLSLYASRVIDHYCGRFFYAKTATRYFDSPRGSTLMLDDDLLSITTLKTDTDGDNAWDDETWTEDTDFHPEPYSDFPKTSLTINAETGAYGWPGIAKGIEIVGLWGYGDGKSATPYALTGGSMTLADATTNDATSVAAGTALIGETLLIESEQVFVTAEPASDTRTVDRAENGTTGAAHDDKTTSLYLYPDDVARACVYLSIAMYHQELGAGFMQERIGDYSYQMLASVVNNVMSPIMLQMLGPYRKLQAVAA